MLLTLLGGDSPDAQLSESYAAKLILVQADQTYVARLPRHSEYAIVGKDTTSTSRLRDLPS